ncbi:hypothetical protein NSQ61_03045 [Aeribacillus sp. FSL K6-1121]|uniref:hypothetical protein n=1 Tax=Aeribacillus sp. FSL K6-1121 TaxID=2954745 RepID=UPI0030F670B7
MKKLVEVVGAVVDGNQPGSKIEIDERSAKHLEKIGYVRILAQEVTGEKGSSAPKKPATRKRTTSKQ